MVLVCVRHEPPEPNSHPFEDYPLAGSAAILCTGEPDVIRKEAWSFYRTSSGVRLCWELEEPKGPNGLNYGWSLAVPGGRPEQGQTGLLPSRLTDWCL